MEKNIILTAISAAVMIWAGSAIAFTKTATMQVTLNNLAVVTVSTTPVAFGEVVSTITRPTGTGTVTVNAPGAIPYKISFSAGSHALATGTCRAMAITGQGSGQYARRYDLFSDAAHTRAWGDSDTDATCAPGSARAGGGTSVAGIGTGADVTRTVYARAGFGRVLGAMSDTVTVTVAY